MLKYNDNCFTNLENTTGVADARTGLTGEQVRARRDAGSVNEIPGGVTPAYSKIFYTNIFTLFNFINLFLALSLVLVGHARNAVFFGVAVFNTMMGVIQEIRAKRTLDKLAILSEGTVGAVRDGRRVRIPQREVVTDDVLYFTAGDQVCADAEVLVSNGLEVNESLLTGESDNVSKAAGAPLLSGSFVAAGSAYARVTAVGLESYANALAVEAKSVKKPPTPMMRTTRRIIRTLTFAIIPIGALLFARRWDSGIPDAVLGSAAAMIGMIPEGLVLLTGVAMTIGALRLARASALVQTLPGIETLARTDIICLDKTGTMTDGTLELFEVSPAPGNGSGDVETALREFLGALPEENAVSVALLRALGKSAEWNVDSIVPFSSERKWSGVYFTDKGAYILGAPRFVMPGGGDIPRDAVESHAKNGRRVLCLARAKHDAGRLANAEYDVPRLPDGLSCVALVVLSDVLRPEAVETFVFFAEEGVELKVISGDDPLTVASIAEKAGIEGSSRHVDMSASEAHDYDALAARYTVFGRASPRQKKELVAAMKRNGRTVCMTGDGVNDVLAMKEADCSVAMRSGSGAARGVSDFVLMTSDFSAMKRILYEGRRVINNIETVSALYLIKTIYSAILSILYMIIPAPFPFAPIQVTPINMFTVGAPSFFLTLRGVFTKPEGRFGSNILQFSLPAAITVAANILLVQLAGNLFTLTPEEMGLMRITATAAAGFYALFRLSRPAGGQLLLFSAYVASFISTVLIFMPFLGVHAGGLHNAALLIPLLVLVPVNFALIRRLTDMARKLIRGF